MHRSCIFRPLRSTHRRGVVMILVLVVVAVISFAIYSFAERTLLEATAARISLDQIQRRELAASAVELSELIIRRPDDQLALATEPVQLDDLDDRIGSLAVVRRIPGANEVTGFGLEDESAKLNLNALPLSKSKRRSSRNRLMALPGMTLQMAAAILDWMDHDDNVFEFGAESSWYTSLKSPYRPRQDRFQDLRELLLVRGVTKHLLFGEDQNGNGYLDPNENDGDLSLPADNADGVLDRGWIQDLTLVSREGTLTPAGDRKIRLNQPELATLHDQLLPGFGREMASFVVAMRSRGARWPNDPPEEKSDEEERRLERLETARQRLQAQLGISRRPRAPRPADSLERDGIRLASPAPYKVKSLLHLFGGQVRISINNEDRILRSPWRADPVTISRLLPLAEQLLTTSNRTALEGRTNINQASEAVLNSIPGMTPSMARSIRRLQPTSGHSTDTSWNSEAWLVARGIMPISRLRQIAPYITVGGDVQGGIALGWFGDAPPVAAIRFLLDCSGATRQVLVHRDLEILTHQRCGLENQK